MKYLKFTSIIVVIYMLVSCTGEPITEEKSIRPIKYTEVSYTNANNVRTFSGISKTDKVIQLSFRSSGVLSEFNINLGQVVKKGQLLAKLDNVQARLNYENAISSKNSADSQMRTAKLSLDRTRALFEKGGSSLSNYESAKNSFRTAQQSHQSAIRSAAIQKDLISYGYLYAPDHGVISSVDVEVNENVNAGQAIATLNSGSDMEIALGLPESIINSVKKGMPVKVNFASIDGVQFDAFVSEVSPSLESDTATYPVTVALDAPSKAVKSGMSANVTFDFEQKTQDGMQQSLIIPAQAVGQDANGKFVFKLNLQGDYATVKKVKIEIGALTTKGFEVTSGLQLGDKIAVAGLQTLLNGQKVKLQ